MKQIHIHVYINIYIYKYTYIYINKYIFMYSYIQYFSYAKKPRMKFITGAFSSTVRNSGVGFWALKSTPEISER